MGRMADINMGKSTRHADLTTEQTIDNIALAAVKQPQSAQRHSSDRLTTTLKVISRLIKSQDAF
jgi:hypothetical protein